MTHLLLLPHALSQTHLPPYSKCGRLPDEVIVIIVIFFYIKLNNDNLIFLILFIQFYFIIRYYYQLNFTDHDDILDITRSPVTFPLHYNLNHDKHCINLVTPPPLPLLTFRKYSKFFTIIPDTIVVVVLDPLSRCKSYKIFIWPVNFDECRMSPFMREEENSQNSISC